MWVRFTVLGLEIDICSRLTQVWLHCTVLGFEIDISSRLTQVWLRFTVLGFSVADPDPGSGAFLTRGPGIRKRFFRITDPGSQTYIFEILVSVFWVKVL
jgi:hypothetical protein